jgi:MFS family permease
MWSRGPYFWRSFLTICIPLLLSALEGSVTNTALPTISEALSLGNKFSWVATAFLLASTVFQPLYGQLADMWGRKYPMMLAVIFFGAGSAICGWSNGAATMILGRIIQGFGTGGIDLFAEIILSDLVPLRQRGTYLAIKNGFFALGTLTGPLFGGFCAEHNWRWAFWINLPVCFLSLIMMSIWLRVGGGIKTKDSRETIRELSKIDAFGTFILTGSVVLILIALSSGGASYPWSSESVITPLVFGILGLAIFPIWERCKYCRYPIMPPTIFSNRTSATAFALTALHGFITYGVQFFLPVFFQAVRGASPVQCGYFVLPTTATIVVMAALGGPLLSRWGKYRPIHQLGFACMTLGCGLYIMMDHTTALGVSIVFQFFAAFGCGIVVSTMLPAVQVGLPDKATGAAAGSWAFLRGTGSLFGVAIPSAIFNLRFTQLLGTIQSHEASSLLGYGRAYQHASSKFVASYGPVIGAQIQEAFTKSLKSVWIVFAAIAGLGMLGTLGERQVKMRNKLDTEYGLKGPKSPSTVRLIPATAQGVVTRPSTPSPASSEEGAAGSGTPVDGHHVAGRDLEKQALGREDEVEDETQRSKTANSKAEEEKKSKVTMPKVRFEGSFPKSPFHFLSRTNAVDGIDEV